MNLLFSSRISQKPKIVVLGSSNGIPYTNWLVSSTSGQSYCNHKKDESWFLSQNCKVNTVEILHNQIYEAYY